MQKLKLLGLMLGAMMALSAVAASAASADLFHIASGGTKLTVASNATQSFQYEEEGATVTCSAIGGSGELAGELPTDANGDHTATAVTYSPTYTGCTIPSISGSVLEVSMNECDYKFTLNTGQTKGPVHIECPAGHSISLTEKLSGSSICTFHIGAQTPAGNLDYANSGNNMTVTPTLTGIVSTKTTDNGFGFLCGGASSTTGTYSGALEIKGENEAVEARKVWVE